MTSQPDLAVALPAACRVLRSAPTPAVEEQTIEHYLTAEYHRAAQATRRARAVCASALVAVAAVAETKASNAAARARRQQAACDRRAVSRLVAQVAGLHTAMSRRAVIEQAKGMLMSRVNCTADEAFSTLVRLSQRQHRKLYDVAADIVESRGRF